LFCTSHLLQSSQLQIFFSCSSRMLLKLWKVAIMKLLRKYSIPTPSHVLCLRSKRSPQQPVTNVLYRLGLPYPRILLPAVRQACVNVYEKKKIPHIFGVEGIVSLKGWISRFHRNVGTSRTEYSATDRGKPSYYWRPRKNFQILPPTVLLPLWLNTTFPTPIKGYGKVQSYISFKFYAYSNGMPVVFWSSQNTPAPLHGPFIGFFILRTEKALIPSIPVLPYT
jgi:hypothetical protein